MAKQFDDSGLSLAIGEPEINGRMVVHDARGLTCWLSRGRAQRGYRGRRERSDQVHGRRLQPSVRRHL
jgi:hypothetical protein